MAMTHDYMDYLDEQISIAPAGSQEELQAAETIANMMREHGCEPYIEEFDARKFANLIPAALLILIFLGIFLAGIGSVLLTAIGFFLVAVPTALFVLKFLGTDVISDLGPAARSQNVIAFHKGCGEKVQKGTRPIVVVAHYDSPHENPLYSTPVAQYLPLLWKYSRYFVLGVAVCTLFQILGFLPEAFRRFLWIIGILGSLPLLLLGVSSFLEHFSPCTLGANDNKSGVAAMLGVLENVMPSGKQTAYEVEVSRAEQRAAEQRAAAARAAAEQAAAAEAAAAAQAAAAQAAAEQAAAAAAARAASRIQILGVRHGEETLRSLGMLPADCEIVYDLEQYAEPSVVEPVAAPVATVVETPAAPVAEVAYAEQTPAYAEPVEPVAPVAPETESFSAQTTASFEQVAEPEAATTMETAPVAAPAPAPEAPAAGDADVTAAQTGNLNFASLSADADQASAWQSAGDTSGLAAEVNTDDISSTQPVGVSAAPKPAAPEDPTWGQSEFEPKMSSVARRASLFDLPAVDGTVKDPFESTNPQGQAVVAPVPAVQVPPTVPAPTPVQAPAQADLPVMSAEDEAYSDFFFEPEGESRSSETFSNFFGKVKEKFAGFSRNKAAGGAGDAEMADDSQAQDGPANHQSPWRGGATTRSDLRVIEGGESAEGAPSEEDLRDAVLSMNDDDLLAHDIWFVALGASGLDHAGMRAFINKHRKDCRGCFVINLDSVGAGDLTVYSNEGLLTTRRTDRRMLRMLTSTAADLHIGIQTREHDWGKTDATVSMLRSMRSATITGLDPATGLTALSRTQDDVAENVDPAQAVQVTQLVTELIRRA